jgi:hypothetical protein
MKTIQTNIVKTRRECAPLSLARAMQVAGRRTRGAARGRAKGLTMLELIVAVALLSIMILTFGAVISSADKMVTVGENSIRANATAAAISQVIRGDLRKLSQSGFFAIVQYNAGGVQGQPQLFFTTAGPSDGLATQSVGANAGKPLPPGDGSIVGYGLVPSTTTMWRSAWVLDSCDRANITPDPTIDCLPLSFSDLQKMPRCLNPQPTTCPPTSRSLDYYWLIAVLQGNQDILKGPNPPYLPALVPAALPNITNVSQLNIAWKYLGTTCNNLSIMWTPDGVYWYGVNIANGTPTVISQAPSPLGTNPAGATEFAPGSNTPYFALWSHENQTNWPKAVKIRFTNATTGTSGADMGNNAIGYEVMCLLGK